MTDTGSNGSRRHIYLYICRAGTKKPGIEKKTIKLIYHE
jgi:hypothetical protein